MTGSETNGGHKTFSTPLISLNFGTIELTSSLASPTVLFIFQFPATSGRLIL
jgi:hypothetical protein